MRHLRCPQRFHPGLEGGELFPPGHDVSRRAWSSFGCSSFSSSLAVPSHSPSRAAATAATAAAAGPSAAARQRCGHAVLCGTPSPQWLAPCPRAARTRGAVGHLRRRSRCTAGSLASAATAKSGRPRARIPGQTFSHCARPRLRQPVGIAQHVKFHPQQAVGTVAVQSGRAMLLSSTARRNAMTQMRRPARQSQPCPGRNVTRWCAARGTKPTHYL